MNSTKKPELPDFHSHTQFSLPGSGCTTTVEDPEVGGPIIVRSSALHDHPSGRLAPSEHHDGDGFPDLGFEKSFDFLSLEVITG
ncbi:hypothetical protein BDV34DRAFT_231773 [Aspergillus parasiticus]|uniref:Uncharacterized protein n=1 Tax=Aspergillus parasiticus TaxID=5067 RepID=A0A5N6D109_ASPPA|nr:hypothetical protein BDV34DRAFT_231773 [Aspergillus parasiticus]